VSAPRPEASVLIATCGRHASLGRCLRALGDQTQDPATFEVVVVDTDPTEATLRLLASLETQFALRVVRRVGVDSTAALAAAVAASEGRVCIFLGERVAAAPKLVAAHLAGHAANERTVGVGTLTHELPDDRDWYARAAAIASNRRFDAVRDERRIGWRHVQAENFSATREALDEAGGLPGISPLSAAIAELAFRLDAAGYRASFLADAHGVRQSDDSGRQLLAEREHDGAAHAELATRHPSMTPGLLGWFADAGPRELIVRRSVLTLRARPSLLAALGRLVPGADRKQQWFTFVSNCAYWTRVRERLTRDEWKQLARGVPVLLYHAFSEHDESNRFVISRRVFARQMRVLSLLGFSVLAYDAFVELIRDGRLPPPRTVVLTIDDGYADNGEIAAAVLERHGFGATIFLVSGRLGGVNDWSEAAPLRGRGLLSVPQLDSLRRRGIEFGAHTRTHACLPDVADETVAEEVESSRWDLEETLGISIRTFAYPYGRLDDRAIAAVERTGFVSACTTDPRLARLDDHPLLIPRIEIRRDDPLWRFLRKVWFGGR
jgi:peptidoglycan/xylan/chitin deacetylase (PgdA/CDA1 family)